MPCPGPFNCSYSVGYIYDFCPFSDPDVGLSIFVCDVEHTSFHFGRCGRKFVQCLLILKVQHPNADLEEIAFTACAVSHRLQSCTADLQVQATARCGTKPPEDYAAKLMPSRSMRSDIGNLLTLPKSSRTLGCHRFVNAAPSCGTDSL